MTLPGVEFLRRFLLHVLPKGFVRIRHFGFLAPRARKNLALCRALLQAAAATARDATVPAAPETDRDEQGQADRCPTCGVGRMRHVAVVQPEPIARIPLPPPDTS
jgi:hypothetical protein